MLHSRDWTLGYSIPTRSLSHLVFKKDDLPLGERIIGPAVETGFLGFCGLHELLEKIRIRAEVDATSVCRVFGIKQAISVMMFLWSTLG